jgi:hypothetical protein
LAEQSYHAADFVGQLLSTQHVDPRNGKYAQGATTGIDSPYKPRLEGIDGRKEVVSHGFDCKNIDESASTDLCPALLIGLACKFVFGIQSIVDSLQK